MSDIGRPPLVETQIIPVVARTDPRFDRRDQWTDDRTGRFVVVGLVLALAFFFVAAAVWWAGGGRQASNDALAADAPEIAPVTVPATVVDDGNAASDVSSLALSPAPMPAQGLALTTQGDNAYRELRSYGQRNIWLCQMGRAARDGSFEEFQRAVLALDVRFENLSARCATLRGETLAFGWEGPLLVDGQEQPLAGFKHYDNPYCVAELGAAQMEIIFGDEVMRLNFE